MYFKSSGSWRECQTGYFKSGGSWRRLKVGYFKSSGSWRICYLDIGTTLGQPTLYEEVVEPYEYISFTPGSEATIVRGDDRYIEGTQILSISSGVTAYGPEATSMITFAGEPDNPNLTTMADRTQGITTINMSTGATVTRNTNGLFGIGNTPVLTFSEKLGLNATDQFLFVMEYT